MHQVRTFFTNYEQVDNFDQLFKANQVIIDACPDPSKCLDLAKAKPAADVIKSIFTSLANNSTASFALLRNKVQGVISNSAAGVSVLFDCSLYANPESEKDLVRCLASPASFEELACCSFEERPCGGIYRPHSKWFSPQYSLEELPLGIWHEYRTERDDFFLLPTTEVEAWSSSATYAPDQFQKFMETTKLAAITADTTFSTKTPSCDPVIFNDLDEFWNSSAPCKSYSFPSRLPLAEQPLLQAAVASAAIAGAAYLAYKVGSSVRQCWNSITELLELVQLEKLLLKPSIDSGELTELHSKLEALAEKTAHVTAEQNFLFLDRLCVVAIRSGRPDILIKVLPRALPGVSKQPNFEKGFATYCQSLENHNMKQEAEAIRSLINEYA